MSQRPRPAPPSAASVAAELGINDPVAGSAYVERFESEFEAAELWPSSLHEYRRVLSDADLVMFGEFHPLDSACRSAVQWLARATPRRSWVGLEMVHVRDQRALDEFVAGRIGAARFRRRIRYAEEWGYPWRGPAAVLDAARRRGVAALALDLPPRGGVDDLELRDQSAAEEIVRGMQRAGKGGRAAILFGEAHLASAHIPALLRAALGPKKRIVRVFHDLDTQRATPRGGAILRCDPGTFVVQRSRSNSRGRALRRIYEGWAHGTRADGSAESSHLFHDLITHLALRLEIDPRQERVGSEARRLAHLYPEVIEASSDRRLRNWGLQARDLASGWRYARGAHLAITVRPSLRGAAVEAARFLVTALCGTIGTSAPRSTPALVWEQALAVALAASSDSGLRRRGSRALDEPWLRQAEQPSRAARRAHSWLRSGAAIELDRVEQRLVGNRLGIELARSAPDLSQWHRWLRSSAGSERELRRAIESVSNRGLNR